MCVSVCVFLCCAGPFGQLSFHDKVFERMEEEDGCVDERTCSHIIGQTASAIAFAHKRNISHRDLKPENICFVSRDRDDHAVKVGQ